MPRRCAVYRLGSTCQPDGSEEGAARSASKAAAAQQMVASLMRSNYVRVGPTGFAAPCCAMCPRPTRALNVQATASSEGAGGLELPDESQPCLHLRLLCCIGLHRAGLGAGGTGQGRRAAPVGNRPSPYPAVGPCESMRRGTGMTWRPPVPAAGRPTCLRLAAAIMQECAAAGKRMLPRKPMLPPMLLRGEPASGRASGRAGGRCPVQQTQATARRCACATRLQHRGGDRSRKAQSLGAPALSHTAA